MNNIENYIYTVYQKMSFSKASQKLYISQPALSTAVKNFEKQLGYKIFNRKTIPLSLTREGELYIEFLEEKKELEEQLKHRLMQVNKPRKKVISIGGASSTSFVVLPQLCKEYCLHFPKVNINIDLNWSNSLQKLENGLLDIVIDTKADSKNFGSTVLWEEKYMVVVRKDYPGANKLYKYALSYDEVLTGVYPPEKIVTDWGLFDNIPIYKLGKYRDAAKIFSDFPRKASHQQVFVTNFIRMDMQYALMEAGLGAVIQPQSVIIHKGYNPDKLLCFDVGVPNNIRKPMLIYRKNALQESHIRDFIELAKEMYSEK